MLEREFQTSIDIWKCSDRCTIYKHSARAKHMAIYIFISENTIRFITISWNVKYIQPYLLEYMRNCFGSAAGTENECALVLESQKGLDALGKTVSVCIVTHLLSVFKSNNIHGANLSRTFIEPI